MPKRDKFFNDLSGENRQAALLMTQVGGMPGELQLVMQTAELDESADGLHPLNSYVIRALGVQEHQLATFGMTVADVQIEKDHPLLYEYNMPPAAVFFKGTPDNVDELTLDIAQAHASTFGPWRHFPEYLNLDQPLATLLNSGGGLIGQMPQPLSERIVKVLEKHGLETKVMIGESEAEKHSHPMVQEVKVLVFANSYVIAYDYSFEELGKV